MELKSIPLPSAYPSVYFSVLLTDSTSSIGQDNTESGEKEIYVAGQITILFVLLVVGFIFWQLFKDPIGEAAFRKLGTWGVAGIFSLTPDSILFNVVQCLYGRPD